MTAHEASSSSSFKSKLWNYDVFLSFRGEDTRTGFTGHLHAALTDRGYQAYIDEDILAKREEIKEKLFQAIEESRISIIVFSKSYADSSWCLDELVKIMECRSKLGQHVLPIFYHVDPSHVRKQNGDLAKAFQNYEEDIRAEKDDKKREAKQERVNQWREALTEAANLAGHHRHITDNRSEAKFIKNIVDENIWKWLPRTDEVSFLSSSKSKLWNYDVYLSFSGVDTRDGFTGHLHAALKDRGYHAYMNEDDLSGGVEIIEEMFRAIEESRISIIVFSKSYADSSWCLDELVKIMECRSKLGQHVLPIFYYVNISNVRKQDGDLAQAFQKHEREAEQERVQQWKKALTEAANLFGHQITDPRSEAMLVRETVDKTKWLLSEDKLHVAKHQVGINSRIEDIITYLSSGGLDDVLMVGIWGMGGSGKTAVAKAIYNQIHHKFQFKSFLADVSDTTSKYGLVYLQETLVSDILNQNKSQMIRNVDDGISLIKRQFRHRRVLVIMDNIDEVKQLNAIAGNHEWFGPGSRIIITTRDEYLLKEVDKIYPLQEMNEVEALELFSWHAFGNRWPNTEYLELSEKIVSYCRGLPLALEVLGSFLFKRSIAEWESKLEKLKRTPDEKIMKALRISFEALDDIEKAMFLDISCFFIGWDKDYVAKVLDGCGFFFATLGISVLRERGLVTIECNELNMHDLVRELARVIISEKSPGHPGKWSRLWNPPDVIYVLTTKSGTEEVEGLALDFPAPCLSSSKTPEVIDVLTNKSGTEEVEGLALDFPDPCLSSSNNAIFSTAAFANMKKLRLLHLKNVQLNEDYKHLPKELIWLCWRGFSLQSIPDDFFNQPRLVVLDMRSSNLVQVWKGSKSLQMLKIIDLSDSIYLIKSPDFSQVPNLEELILEGCESLSEIHPSIGYLKRLSLVNLKNCCSLSSLPRDFYKSKSVEILCLNGCSNLRELHEDLGEMVSLRILEAENTSIKRVPASMARLKNLTRLSVRFG
ncbi:unnamed protein product [Malus baccata var. baccata]